MNSISECMYVCGFENLQIFYCLHSLCTITVCFTLLCCVLDGKSLNDLSNNHIVLHFLGEQGDDGPPGEAGLPGPFGEKVGVQYRSW